MFGYVGVIPLGRVLKPRSRSSLCDLLTFPHSDRVAVRPRSGLTESDSSLCSSAGDEIFSVNGESLRGFSHAEAIAAFKKTKTGQIVLQIGRRETVKKA